MPLSAAKPSLEIAIKTAFENVKSSGEQDGANPSSVMATLASELASAIHSYVTQATVKTDVVVKPGILTAGSPSAQMTTTAGSGTGVGSLM